MSFDYKKRDRAEWALCAESFLEEAAPAENWNPMTIRPGQRGMFMQRKCETFKEEKEEPGF